MYAGVAGPSYETSPEARALAALGADVLGMSTVIEVIAARQMGLACLVASLVSNPAAGGSGAGLDHDAVVRADRAAAGELARLLRALLEGPGLLPYG